MGGTTHKPSCSRSGGGVVDGDGSGGQSPSRQGAGTGTSDPRNLSSMAAALRNPFWNMTDCLRVFGAGALYRRKGGARGWPSRPHHVVAPPPSRPRGDMVRRPWASPGLALLAPCTCRENRRLGFCFVQFRKYFLK